MRVRNITTCALGLAAALTVVASPLAAQQQDTTRLRTTSQTRIGVSKGEVVTARVDTVFITRYDTVRVDNTIVRVDTVTVATPAPIIPAKMIGPFYWALFAGTTWPYGNVDRLYTNGFHGGGAIGWEPRDGFLGVRLEAALSQIGREQGRLSSLVGTGTPLMWHLAGDLKAKVINVGGWSFYGLGGLNYNRYKRIATVAESGTGGAVCGAQFDGQGGCYIPASDTEWSDKFGFNFGLGTDFHIGSQDMFLEARMVALTGDGARTWFLPVSLGVRYF